MRARRRQPPHQATLFEDPGPAVDDSTALVKIAPQETPPSALQRTFNQLTDKIRRERAALAEWESYEGRHRQRLAAELDPAVRRVREAQRRFVLQLAELLDSHENGERLSRRHRARARAQMLSVIDDILAEGGRDAELEALHDRHCELSRADMRRQEVAVARSVLGEMVGDDVMEGLEANDIDQLFAQASAKLAEREASEARAREEDAARRESRRGRSARAEQAAQRKANAEREAGQSLRDTFRKLASALHPDRETDPAEQERKTKLMQRVNVAYERRDLLELLALQIEIEQIDATYLSSVPERRLRHYNHVLREQLAALKAEVAEYVARFAFELPSLRNPTPRAADQALSELVAEARSLQRRLEQETDALADPRQRPRVLDELPDPDDIMLPDFLDVFAAGLEPRSKPGGRNPDKRKRRKSARR